MCLVLKSSTMVMRRLPLWSSGQSSWLQIGGPGSIPGTTRKKSSGSGMGCTQPREYN
jgi:hypothetical protein